MIALRSAGSSSFSKRGRESRYGARLRSTCPPGSAPGVRRPRGRFRDGSACAHGCALASAMVAAVDDEGGAEVLAQVIGHPEAVVVLPGRPMQQEHLGALGAQPGHILRPYDDSVPERERSRPLGGLGVVDPVVLTPPTDATRTWSDPASEAVVVAVRVVVAVDAVHRGASSGSTSGLVSPRSPSSITASGPRRQAAASRSRSPSRSPTMIRRAPFMRPCYLHTEDDVRGPAPRYPATRTWWPWRK